MKIFKNSDAVYVSDRKSWSHGLKKQIASKLLKNCDRKSSWPLHNISIYILIYFKYFMPTSPWSYLRPKSKTNLWFLVHHGTMLQGHDKIYPNFAALFNYNAFHNGLVKS